MAPQRPSEVTLVGVEQDPNGAWQPAPQCSVALPQKPFWEQQLPKSEPAHVLPLAPHSPFADTPPSPSEQVPKPVTQPPPQWAVVLPQ